MTEWAAFIDGDEYLFGTSEDLKAILAEVGAAALCVHWLIFGSSGRTEAPDGLNIESFTRRAREDADANQIYKSIIRPRRALDYVNAHRFTLNGPMVNERGEVLPPEGHRAKTPSHARIRINHYMVRSFAEWKLKQARGDPRPEGHPQKRRADGFFADYDRNEREDLCALRFRDAVVATLAELAGETPAKTS
jgi:hypothetical protein